MLDSKSVPHLRCVSPSDVLCVSQVWDSLSARNTERGAITSGRRTPGRRHLGGVLAGAGASASIRATAPDPSLNCQTWIVLELCSLGSLQVTAIPYTGPASTLWAASSCGPYQNSVPGLSLTAVSISQPSRRSPGADAGGFSKIG